MSKKITKLREELSALRLTWQTGKPPKDGWYWIVQMKELDPVLAYWKKDRFFIDGYADPHVKWAGPIPEPGEK